MLARPLSFANLNKQASSNFIFEKQFQIHLVIAGEAVLDCRKKFRHVSAEKQVGVGALGFDRGREWILSKVLGK